MRLLLDQMLDVEVATAVRLLGHDVVRVSDLGMATASDQEILRYAVRDARVLVTLDEHFGDWTFLKLGEHPGVLRIKSASTATDSILLVLLPFLQSHGAAVFANQLVIIAKHRVRWISSLR
ncbi:MAG: DUF5615 family PIN-like protein [bacterium]